MLEAFALHEAQEDAAAHLSNLVPCTQGLLDVVAVHVVGAGRGNVERGTTGAGSAGLHLVLEGICISSIKCHTFSVSRDDKVGIAGTRSYMVKCNRGPASW